VLVSIDYYWKESSARRRPIHSIEGCFFVPF
jgi:hypothetical protein